MFCQFVPQVIGCTQTNALGGSLYPNALTATARPCLTTPLLITGTDSNMAAWLKIPPESVQDSQFIDSNRSPVTLRIWTEGSGFSGAGLVLPTYRLGVFRPATYTPDAGVNGVAGSYDPATPVSTWLSSTTTDAHAADGSDWTSIVETTITVTGHSATLILSTYKRGELVIYVTLPESTSGVRLYILGCGWRS